MEWAKLVPELTVSNLKESLRFYVEGIGFQMLFERHEPPFAYLSYEGAQLMLEERHMGGWETAPLRKPFGRGINFQIECGDIQAVHGRLTKAGYSIYRAVTEAWYTVGDKQFGALEFLVQDPDGYLLRFSEDLGTRSVPK